MIFHYLHYNVYEQAQVLKELQVIDTDGRHHSHHDP